MCSPASGAGRRGQTRSWRAAWRRGFAEGLGWFEHGSAKYVRAGAGNLPQDRTGDRMGGQDMRYVLVVLAMLFGGVSSANAQVSIAIGYPGVSIGINVPVYPEFVPVPGYPVYYAPRMHANYFFYDGVYWVYRGGGWYASNWYNGPWTLVDPYAVPAYVLRIPVRYYRDPPSYFHAWRRDEPPRWGEHWGHDWDRDRRGWDHWDRRAVPARAPLPRYQERYSGDRYPHVEDRQRELESRHYRYEPRDPDVRQHYVGRSRDRDMRQRYEERGQVPDARQHYMERGQASDVRQQHYVERSPSPDVRQHYVERGPANDPGPGNGRGPNDERGQGRGRMDQQRSASAAAPTPRAAANSASSPSTRAGAAASSKGSTERASE